MSKFNSKSSTTGRTVNHEGATAFTLSPEMELYALAVTTMLSDKFYEGSNETVQRIEKLIPLVRPEFVAKLAVYARENMHLRSLPIVLSVLLSKNHNGDDLVRKTTRRVIARADEITEALSCYSVFNVRESGAKKLNKISKQFLRGIADAFNKFDEYQFAKYDRSTAISLRDALFLAHPKAETEKQQALFDKIVKGELETPYTWEVELSKGGDKTKTWEALIDSGKVGYMALLRNLRNIIEANVSLGHLAKVCETIANPEAVRKSKQFPFRFLSAYREIVAVASGRASMVLDALESAMIASAENITGFGYDTAVTIACDVSGSMQHNISEKSKVQLYDVGLVLGMLLHHKSKNIETGIFGDTWKIVNLPKNNILANTTLLHKMEGEVGYSTNGYLVIEDLINRSEVKDKVMIFTDCQLYGKSELSTVWSKYRAKIAPNAKLYLFDLSGYGNTPVSIRQDGVYLIAGWSNAVFDMLEAYDRGSSALGEIETIEL